jgi:hypothetical protein
LLSTTQEQIRLINANAPVVQVLIPGFQGPPGWSAYEQAVLLGFVGSEQDWINSLEGPPGPLGPPGPSGTNFKLFAVDGNDNAILPTTGRLGEAGYAQAIDTFFVCTSEGPPAVWDEITGMSGVVNNFYQPLISNAGLLANRFWFDNQPAGFAYLTTDTQEVYVRENGPGQWGPGIPFRGPPGDRGPAGQDGQDGRDGQDGQDGQDEPVDTYLPLAGGVMTGNLTAPSLNGGQLAGLRNRIINGSFMVDQRRENSVTAIPLNSEAWTCDRWFAGSYGAAGLAIRVIVGGPSPTLLRLRSGAGNTNMIAAQRIESWNCDDLAGKTVSLSLSTRATVGGTLTWQLKYANTRDTHGLFQTPTATLIATGTWTISNTMQRYEAQIDIPVAAVTGLQLSFSLAGVTSGDWEITEVQLEEGPAATPFEHLPVSTELQLCQRYFQWLTYNHSWFAAFAGLGLETGVTWPHMRASPTVGTIVADPYTAFFFQNASTFDIVRITPYGGAIRSIGVAVGQVMVVGYRASADAEIP